MKKLSRLSILKSNRGVTAIVVGISIVVLVGFAALAIDIGHLYVARNELQNAADAGALAGAAVLYNDSGTGVNENANQVAYEAATANKSEKVPVDVNWRDGNEGDVQRGHWSFATRTFTANASLEPVELWGVSAGELDGNTDFINAMRVVARRQATPVASFFARIFGHESFELSAEAVAYIGFTGKLLPHDVDQPIAICKQSILDEEGNYNCNIGRMINSGQNEANSETGGWTSFSQDDPCTGGTNAQEVKDLVCGDGNPEIIQLGGDIATNGGQIQSAFDELIDCWKKALYDSDGDNVKDSPIDTDDDGLPDMPWNLTLPVVNCPGNNMGTCEEIVGAVNLNIIWIVRGNDEVPERMGDWSGDGLEGEERWNNFVDHFHLKNVDGNPAPYAKKSIYFLPDCTPHEPAGVSGGENYGVLAKIPVLVK